MTKAQFYNTIVQVKLREQCKAAKSSTVTICFYVGCFNLLANTYDGPKTLFSWISEGEIFTVFFQFTRKIDELKMEKMCFHFLWFF